MTVGEAKATARRWVEENSGEVPGLLGVFYGGSINSMHEGVLLEPSYHRYASFTDAETALVVRFKNPVTQNK
jgi:hypothetical protein